MLTAAEIRKHLERVTYKPGWTFVCYEDERFQVRIRITGLVSNSYAPEETTTTIVQHAIRPYLETVEEFDRWMISRLVEMEMHELREFYQVDGVSVSDPHKESVL